MPNGRCKMHGGKSTGVIGNKNAVKTGERESIYADTLTDEERAIFASIDVDRLVQIDEQIRLSTIRIRRMMQRIARLADVDLTVVEESFEKGIGAQGPIDKSTRKLRGALGQIQDIEEAITRVQASHARLISEKHKIISAEPPEDDEDIGDYVEALSTAAASLTWPSREDEE